MPRKYIRKTNRQNWNEDAMTKALDAVKDGLPFKTASKQFTVPVMALKRRAKGKNKIAVGAVKTLGSKQTVFTSQQENELVEHIKDMESRMYGLTKQDILSLAYQLAVKNNIPNPFSAQKEKAGVDWLRGFRKRHPDITLRSPESTSAARARAFNKPVVDKFFSVLNNTQEKHHIPPHRIFNVDETSLCTVPTKNTKVFAQAGRKQVARVTSAERGDTTTAVICCSAAGSFIPPMFIFRRLRMKIELMDGAPPGSVYACNSSGWMKLEVFDQWFCHFLAHVKPSADDPAILILDGHLSHTKNLNVVLKARDNHVIIICLPPHCTHKLQPLDVGVMYPLSVYHNQELEKWMNNHPGRVVTVFQITKVFAGAYLKAAVPLNAINGFLKCGICPLNQDVFTDVDYVAAETTKMEKDLEFENSLDSLSILDNALSTLAETNTAATVEDLSNLNPGSSPEKDIEVDPVVYENISDRKTPSPEFVNMNESLASPLCDAIYSQNDESQQPVMPFCEETNTSTNFQSVVLSDNNECRRLDKPSSELAKRIKSPQGLVDESLQSQVIKLISNLIMPTSPAESQDIDSVTTPTINTTLDLPSTSFGVFSPRDLRPLPKIEGKRNKNLRKRKIDTSILTSTPYKTYLEEEMQKKKEKEQKQRSRKDKILKTMGDKNKKGKGMVKGQKSKQGNRIIKKKDTKTKRLTKGIKRAKKTYDSESSVDEEDAECWVCSEPYSKDAMGEGWVLCVKCFKWGHEACTGIDSDDDGDYVCDICVDQIGNTKKYLKF